MLRLGEDMRPPQEGRGPHRRGNVRLGEPEDKFLGLLRQACDYVHGMFEVGFVARFWWGANRAKFGLDF